VTPQAITRNIKAIYEESELEQNVTCNSYLQVRQEGTRQVSRNTLHYSLPIFIAVATASALSAAHNSASGQRKPCKSAWSKVL